MNHIGIRAKTLIVLIVAAMATAVTPSGKSAGPAILDGNLSQKARRFALQDPRFKLTAASDSDPVDADVYGAVDTAGGLNVLVIPRGLGYQAHLRKWFFDYSTATFKVIELRTESDAERVYLE